MENKQLTILTLIWFRSCSASCRNCSSSLIFSSLCFSHSTREENLPRRGKKEILKVIFLLFRKHNKNPKNLCIYLFLFYFMKGFQTDNPFSTPC